MDFEIAQQLIVSLALGMLIGLQRERSGSAIGGIRTFPLIMLFGTISGQLARVHGGWVLGAGLLALAALLLVPNLPQGRTGENGGITTEIAAVLLYALGAFLVTGPIYLGVVTGGAVALLLHWKENLHRFARTLGDADMQAIMRFVLISMVILPTLPHENYGPYSVLNPFEIWLMVVLIVGMSLCGYVVYKLVGARDGVVLAGVLGGLISSTATAVSSARNAKGAAAAAPLSALLIMIASTVAMLRVLVEIGLVASGSFSALAVPLATMLGAMVVISLVGYVLVRQKRAKMPEQTNPAELKPALIFALVYAVIKLAVAAGNDHFGQSGLYIVGVISGLADMDAITLSTARMVGTRALDAEVGWRTILIAAMSNLAFKGAVVGILGGTRLFLHVGLLFAASLAAGGAILAFWP